jgi:hypothetical protein
MRWPDGVPFVLWRNLLGSKHGMDVKALKFDKLELEEPSHCEIGPECFDALPSSFTEPRLCPS